MWVAPSMVEIQIHGPSLRMSNYIATNRKELTTIAHMIIMSWFIFLYFLILQVFVILTKHYIIEMLLKVIFIFVKC
jgi:hypothetical protein